MFAVWRRFFVLIGFGSLFFSTGNLFASSPFVALDDSSYLVVDHLLAADLLDDVVMGHRPWTRQEFARLIREARGKFDATGQLMGEHRINLERELVFLEKEFQRELEEDEKNYFRMEGVNASYTFQNSPERVIPPDNGLGRIHGDINSLTANRGGLNFADGHTLRGGFAHDAGFWRAFTLFGDWQSSLFLPEDGSSNHAQFTAEELYLKWGIQNFEVSGGRQHILWGQGKNTGLLLSNNARALDSLYLSTPHPFHLPWVLRHLGPARVSFFISNLGPEDSSPYTTMYGAKLSVHPASWFEVGFNHIIKMGGEGREQPQWSDPITEAIFIRRGSLRGTASNVADHRFGYDWRFTIPSWNHLQWYVEGGWEDFARETFLVNITQQMGWMTGFYLPRVDRAGKNSLRAEVHHLPPVFYRHASWEDGFTLNRRLLGSAAGPDADTVWLEWLCLVRPDLSYGVEAGYENRDSDDYTSTLSSKGQPDRVVKVTDHMTEHRLLFLGTVNFLMHKTHRLKLRGGLERAFNFNFVDQDRTNFLIELGWMMF